MPIRVRLAKDFTVGQRVAVNSKYRRINPKTGKTTGEIIGGVQQPDCVSIKWDGFKTRERVHRSMFDIVQPETV